MRVNIPGPHVNAMPPTSCIVGKQAVERTACWWQIVSVAKQSASPTEENANVVKAPLNMLLTHNADRQDEIISNIH